MKFNGLLSMAFSVFVLAFAAPVCPAETAAELDMDLSGDYPVVSLGGQPMANIDISVFTRNWGKRAVDISSGRTTHDASGRSFLASKALDRLFGYDLNIRWTSQRMEFDFSYEFPKGGPYVYGAFDIFLDKELFPNRGAYGLGKDNLGTRLKSSDVEFANALGLFKFTLTSDDAGMAPWSLRDTSAHLWRGEPFRSLSLLNCTRKTKEGEAIGRQTAHVVIEYTPSPDAESRLKVRAALRIVRALKGKTFSQEELSRLVSLESRLAGLLADGPLNAAAVDALASEAAVQAIALAERCNSYATGGVIIPAPRSFKPAGGRFTLDSQNRIATTPDAGTEVRRCAEILSAGIKEDFGMDVPVAVGGEGRISLKLESEPLPGGQEAYVLQVDAGRVAILGNSARGIFNGVQSLLQLLEKDGDLKISAGCGTIRDWPDIQFRGMLVELGRQNTFPWVMRFIERVVARCKYNTVVLGEPNTCNIKWDSHPELSGEGSLTTRDVRGMVDKSRALFLEPVPFIEATGHNQNTIAIHPELAESQDPKNRGNALCLSNPATRKMLAGIFDEVVSIYKPKYFYFGADEVCPVGVDARCKGRTAAGLFAEHVKWGVSYLKSKGVENVIIPHDMLLDRTAWPQVVPANSNSTGDYTAVVHPAVKLLPKDVIICYWSYDETGRMPGIPYFQQFGYRVLGSSWYDDRNAYDMSSAVRAYGAMGMLDTSWVITSLKNQASLISIENAWAVDKTPFEKIPYDPVRRMQAAMLPSVPSNFAGVDSVPADIGRRCNAYADDVLNACGVAGALLLPEGRRRVGDINFLLQEKSSRGWMDRLGLASAEKRMNVVAIAGPGAAVKGLNGCVKGIEVGRKARSLAFLHAAMAGGQLKEAPIATYLIRYKDGGSIAAPVTRRVNVESLRTGSVNAEYKRRGFGSAPEAKRIWFMTDRGEELNFHVFEWINPAPEREIESFEVAIDPKCRDGVFLLLGAATVE